MWRGGKKMKIAMIGLGRMGMNMAKRLLQGGHEVVAYNRTPQKTDEIVREGAIGAYTIDEFIKKLPTRKIIFIMVTAGKPVDIIIENLVSHLSNNDMIIDGGNSYFEDSMRRYNMLKEKGIRFLDAGTSGGIEGATHGACMMIGGDKEVFKEVEEIFDVKMYFQKEIDISFLSEGFYILTVKGESIYLDRQLILH